MTFVYLIALHHKMLCSPCCRNFHLNVRNTWLIQMPYIFDSIERSIFYSESAHAVTGYLKYCRLQLECEACRTGPVNANQKLVVRALHPGYQHDHLVYSWQLWMVLTADANSKQIYGIMYFQTIYFPISVICEIMAITSLFQAIFSSLLTINDEILTLEMPFASIVFSVKIYRHIK